MTFSTVFGLNFPEARLKTGRRRMGEAVPLFTRSRQLVSSSGSELPALGTALICIRVKRGARRLCRVAKSGVLGNPRVVSLSGARIGAKPIRRSSPLLCRKIDDASDNPPLPLFRGRYFDLH